MAITAIKSSLMHSEWPAAGRSRWTHNEVHRDCPHMAITGQEVMVQRTER